MKAKIYNFDNKETGSVELNDGIFGLPKKEDILVQVVNWQLAKRRSGNQSTLTRSEVHGTTKKPFKQKGTGNARQGSLKGPHQTGGGVAHAPKPRSFEGKLNKKLRAKALKTALSVKLAENKLRILDTVETDDSKTSAVSKKISGLGSDSILFVRGSNAKDNFYLASRAIKGIDTIPQIGLNVYDILKHDQLVITSHALEDLQKRLA